MSDSDGYAVLPSELIKNFLLSNYALKIFIIISSVNLFIINC